MVMFTTTAAANYVWSGVVGVAIYNNNEGNPGTPGSIIYKKMVEITSQIVNNKYIDLEFESPVPLEANKKYWAAITSKSDNNVTVFFPIHEDYRPNHRIVVKGDLPGSKSFPSIATYSSDLSDEAFWFRIYNPNSAVGVGIQGAAGTPGSASAAFRACLDIPEDANLIKPGNEGTNEIKITLPNHKDPTSYQTIIYNKVNYSNPSSSFILSNDGVITVKQPMRAQIIYITTLRSQNNDAGSCFVKLEIYESGTNSWTEIENSNASGTVKQANLLKQNCTGNVIKDLNANDKIRARISKI